MVILFPGKAVKIISNLAMTQFLGSRTINKKNSLVKNEEAGREYKIIERHSEGCNYGIRVS